MSRPAYISRKATLMDQRRAQEKIQKVLLTCLRIQPHCAALFYKFNGVPVLEYDPRDDFHTLGVDDSLNLYYFVPFVLDCSEPLLVFGLLHETWHVLLQHSLRAKRVGVPHQDHERRLWNHAGDIEINEGLKEVSKGSGRGLLDCPENRFIFASTYGFPRGETAEFYYAELLKRGQTTTPQNPEKPPPIQVGQIVWRNTDGKPQIVETATTPDPVTGEQNITTRDLTDDEEAQATAQGLI